MRTYTRVVGSGYTTLTWNNQPIAWLDTFSEGGQKPIGGTSGPGFDIVQPLGSPVPVEVATSRYLQAGTFSFSIRELWNAPAWTQLQGLAETISGGVPVNIVDIFAAQAASTTPIGIQLIIKPPGTTNWRGWVYNSVTITGIGDGEEVSIGTMTLGRPIVGLYLSKTPLLMSGPANS
jgi:hypothetical protein